MRAKLRADDVSVPLTGVLARSLSRSPRRTLAGDEDPEVLLSDVLLKLLLGNLGRRRGRRWGGLRNDGGDGGGGVGGHGVKEYRE